MKITLSILTLTILISCNKNYTCVCYGELNNEEVIETKTLQAKRQSKVNDKCMEGNFTNIDGVEFSCGI